MRSTRRSRRAPRRWREHARFAPRTAKASARSRARWSTRLSPEEHGTRSFRQDSRPEPTTDSPRPHCDEGDNVMEIILPAYKAVGERRYRETSGLYFEDFEPGHVFQHPPAPPSLHPANPYFTLLT